MALEDAVDVRNLSDSLNKAPTWDGVPEHPYKLVFVPTYYRVQLVPVLILFDSGLPDAAALLYDLASSQKKQ